MPPPKHHPTIEARMQAVAVQKLAEAEASRFFSGWVVKSRGNDGWSMMVIPTGPALLWFESVTLCWSLLASCQGLACHLELSLVSNLEGLITVSETNYHRSPSHEMYAANACLVFVPLVRWGDVEGSLSDKFVTNWELTRQKDGPIGVIWLLQCPVNHICHLPYLSHEAFQGALCLLGDLLCLADVHAPHWRGEGPWHRRWGAKAQVAFGYRNWREAFRHVEVVFTIVWFVFQDGWLVFYIGWLGKWWS